LKEVVLIGYSGHAYIAQDILTQMGHTVVGYCDKEEKGDNPFGLEYFGDESDSEVIVRLAEYDCFIGIGDGTIREKITAHLTSGGITPLNAVHPSAYVAESVQLGTGVMVGAKAIINAFSTIGDGAICNSGSIVEHECKVGGYSHIAPGAVLCGSVTIGAGTLIGANSTVLVGVKIGANVTVGAGAIVLEDIPASQTVFGNPARAH
jgi:sugar O-acyltransferase (sialic acid O-acetyltransferase NeuD family)